MCTTITTHYDTFNQFLVDIYAKIEFGRLLFILRSKTNVELNNRLIYTTRSIPGKYDDLCTMAIMPSSFKDGPMHVHART